MELWNGKPPWPPFWFCRRRPFPLAHTTFSLPVILFGCRKPSRSHQSGSFYLCRVSFPAYTLPSIISITLLAVFFLSLSPSWLSKAPDSTPPKPLISLRLLASEEWCVSSRHTFSVSPQLGPPFPTAVVCSVSPIPSATLHSFHLIPETPSLTISPIPFSKILLFTLLRKCHQLSAYYMPDIVLSPWFASPQLIFTSAS